MDQKAALDKAREKQQENDNFVNRHRVESAQEAFDTAGEKFTKAQAQRDTIERLAAPPTPPAAQPASAPTPAITPPPATQPQAQASAPAAKPAPAAASKSAAKTMSDPFARMDELHEMMQEINFTKIPALNKQREQLLKDQAAGKDVQKELDEIDRQVKELKQASDQASAEMKNLL